jgi:hypothetical protein
MKLGRSTFFALLLSAMAVQACRDTGTPPADTVRFGQLGEVEIGVVAPLYYGQGSGELQQILTWGSNGSWVLREIISYRGLEGDETVVKKEGDPVAVAAYASLIAQLDQKTGVELSTVSPDPPVGCHVTRTRVTVTIWDQLRQEEKKWVRCADETLAKLKTSEAGPDLDAGRVIQAAILVRDNTVGSGFESNYAGSVAFGTLVRSEDSGARYDSATVFVSVPAGNPNPPTNWLAFWRDHSDVTGSAVPEVDWTREMAIVAAVGARTEAGDSIEVRRILSTGTGTQVTLFERVPGDFCSPASRTHYPVHVIVAPRTLEPIRFSEIVQERVNCGE